MKRTSFGGAFPPGAEASRARAGVGVTSNAPQMNRASREIIVVGMDVPPRIACFGDCGGRAQARSSIACTGVTHALSRTDVAEVELACRSSCARRYGVK